MEIDINKVRKALLDLHSVLLNYQKHEYELSNKSITNPNEYFGLVTNHPDFKWLRVISELIVSIDESIENNEGLNIKDLLAYTTKTLFEGEKSGVFETNYNKAIKQDANVALAHSRLKELLHNLE